ncbi:hypothetical protein E8E12_003948 [Didymella heteroderae]|uniref:Uncharacterized protein n=1 Tax=Didymella heteroderae TaxID=1769908 RepID=A0A9P5BXM1_9PLEO|nr:hypothetical protein E8E12_003948 [Didymella heteroderae]
MLKVGRAYDKTMKGNETGAVGDAFSKWTIKVSILSFRNQIKRYHSRDDPGLWNPDKTGLETYLRQSLLKLRRSPGLQIHNCSKCYAGGHKTSRHEAFGTNQHNAAQASLYGMRELTDQLAGERIDCVLHREIPRPPDRIHKAMGTLGIVNASTSSFATPDRADPTPSGRSFPFERLPKDICRMVYDYLPEREHRLLLHAEHGLYYEAQTVPVALLRVNKFFHKEVGACLSEHLQTGPIVILCRQDLIGFPSREHIDALNFAGPLIRMVDVRRQYDLRRRQANTPNISLPQPTPFDRWTLKVPMKAFESEIDGLMSDRSLPPLELNINVLCFMTKPSKVKIANAKKIGSRTWAMFNTFVPNRHYPSFITILAQRIELNLLIPTEEMPEWKCLVTKPTEEKTTLFANNPKVKSNAEGDRRGEYVIRLIQEHDNSGAVDEENDDAYDDGEDLDRFPAAISTATW